MGNWDEKVKIKIQEKLNEANEKDLRFFRIEEFTRNVERTHKYSGKCPVCTSNIIDIESIAEIIGEAVHIPGKSRREYDKLISKLSSHMRKDHKIFPPYYHSYLYSFFGAVIGLILGYFGYKLFPTPDFIVFISIFVVGLITGNFVGNIKDKKIRNENKLM